MTEIDKIIVLLQFGEYLKETERSGWSLAGVKSKRLESVAEHSFGSIFSSIILAEYLRTKGYTIDIEKVAIMATLHDLPEAITGDIARTEEFMKNSELVEEKREAENEAIEKMLKPLNEQLGRFSAIWEEYRYGKSLESRVVLGADLIDMLAHAVRLEQLGSNPKKLQQFFESSEEIISQIDLEIVTRIFDSLRKQHLQS